MPKPSRPYPHLLTEDITVWERYLELHPDLYQSIEYDVRVGDGRDPGPDYADNIRQMALDLSRRRIDAIGHTNTDITLIEITRRAGLTAVGQLFTYPVLYAQSYPTTKPVKVLLVCERLATGVAPVLLQHHITWETV